MCLFISVLPGIPSQYLLAQSQQWKPVTMFEISSKKPEELEQITHIILGFPLLAMRK